jgi:hypothetical protein
VDGAVGMVIVDLARTDSARARCSYATRNVIAQGARRRAQLFNDLRFAKRQARQSFLKR